MLGGVMLWGGVGFGGGGVVGVVGLGLGWWRRDDGGDGEVETL